MNLAKHLRLLGLQFVTHRTTVDHIFKLGSPRAQVLVVIVLLRTLDGVDVQLLFLGLQLSVRVPLQTSSLAIQVSFVTLHRMQPVECILVNSIPH